MFEFYDPFCDDPEKKQEMKIGLWTYMLFLHR